MFIVYLNEENVETLTKLATAKAKEIQMWCMATGDYTREAEYEKIASALENLKKTERW